MTYYTPTNQQNFFTKISHLIKKRIFQQHFDLQESSQQNDLTSWRVLKIQSDDQLIQAWENLPTQYPFSLVKNLQKEIFYLKTLLKFGYAEIIKEIETNSNKNGLMMLLTPKICKLITKQSMNNWAASLMLDDLLKHPNYHQYLPLNIIYALFQCTCTKNGDLTAWVKLIKMGIFIDFKQYEFQPCDFFTVMTKHHPHGKPTDDFHFLYHFFHSNIQIFH